MGAFPVSGSTATVFLARAVARILVWMLVLQPVYVAYAVEVEEVYGDANLGVGVALEDVEGETEDPVVVDETDDVGDDALHEDNLVGAVAHVADVDDVTITNESSEPEVSNTDTAMIEQVANDGVVATSSEVAATTEAQDVAATNTQAVDTGNASVSDSTSTTTTEIASSTRLLTDGAVDNSAATSSEIVASSTTDSATETEPIVVPKQPAYTFDEGDCTLVTDGEFYCVASGIERQATGDPRVYAEKDREGDREIYYFDGVSVRRITNNGYDDFAPVFDAEYLQIAWQAMIQDRLQIMIHDLETNTTRQVTTGRENSSNPDLAGGILVFQQWVDTNWEVMRTVIPKHGEPFELERLTDNAVHDMFPRVYDHLITWQREKGSSWEVVVHDPTTGRTHELEKSDTTRYDNPRFVLLFDSTHDNGDVETIGYDLESGKMMELGTRANPQPIVPQSPKDEVPDVPVQAASSTQVKVGRDEGEDSDETVW